MGIIVLGMHRSGTSALTRLLNLMGCSLGPEEGLAAPAPDNPAGFWERLDVRRTHDRLLAAMGLSWADCLGIDLGGIPQSEQAQFEWSAQKIAEEMGTQTPWVLKDPRFSLLLDAWLPFLPDPVCVFVHRDPLASAQSLSRRNTIELPWALALWEHYNLSGLRAVEKLPRVGIAYEDLLSNPMVTAKRLLAQLETAGVQGLDLPDEEAVLSFIDPSLNHHDPSGDQTQSVTASDQQLDLLRGLRDGSAFVEEIPPLSDKSKTILGKASQAWPGQNWLTRLLRERDKEIAELNTSLESAEARANPTRIRPSGLPRALDEDRVPGVFILGAPRSGTSMFSWAIAAHPAFQTSAESDFLLTLFGGARLHGSYKSAYERPDVGWLKKMEVGYREFSAFAGMGIEHLYLDRYEGRRWVDATPGYTSMGEDLLLLFPAAQFLHIVRDGRAVVNSMCSSGFPAAWAQDFKKACETWSHYVKRGRALVEAHSDRVREIRYESLTAAPEAEMQRVFDFLQEDPCEDSVNLISTKRINSSYGNVDQDDIRKAKDPKTAPERPWQNWDEAQRETFLEIAGPVMTQMGYPLELEGDTE